MPVPSLSLAEWIVLTLVDEGPAHGFAIAALTAEDGDVGRAWHVPRPIVYRAADRLTAAGLLVVTETTAGHRGPQRSILTTTEAGAAAVADWLARPVGHVRDLRSEFLVKLALLTRRGCALDALVAAQREVLAPLEPALARRRAEATGFTAILAAWRHENARAALSFLDGLA
ncbi:PadR family transcriptional regulator [Dactylosporangium sp. NPDC051485]|uniref:PadR family transcriptional regulator n=1 Tax=Dactylosporangium sp. NPDC051485 TaxID=3154846 RepID=UPI0034384DD5